MICTRTELPCVDIRVVRVLKRSFQFPELLSGERRPVSPRLPKLARLLVNILVALLWRRCSVAIACAHWDEVWTAIEDRRETIAGICLKQTTIDRAAQRFRIGGTRCSCFICWHHHESESILRCIVKDYPAVFATLWTMQDILVQICADGCLSPVSISPHHLQGVKRTGMCIYTHSFISAASNA